MRRKGARRTVRLTTMRLATILPFAVAMALLTTPLVAGDRDGDHGRDHSPPTPFAGTVPKAHCGPADHTESGLQGETTQQERFGGDSITAYNCNLQLVGEEPQDTYQGAYSQDGPAYYDVCAYYGTDRFA